MTRTCKLNPGLIILAAGLLVLASACGLRGIAPAPQASPNFDLGSLYRPLEGEAAMSNGMWTECPPETMFDANKDKVVIADLKGPGIITMIHFALPAATFYSNAGSHLSRDTVLRIFWDGETSPSVEAPLADFFCDPNGSLELVDSILVNKKRGWNCYFPMPFTKSARVEVGCDNPRKRAWEVNPCYAYVMYRKLKAIPSDSLYFHATWRQQKLFLGHEVYNIFEAEGKGHFIGWNMTVRGVGSPTAGAPVDENAQFFTDGNPQPVVEWMGLEDSFGFSWGFPDLARLPYTGYQPYLGNGAAAYRFCLNDRIGFKKSIQGKVAFGAKDSPAFRPEYSKPESVLEFSSVAYWYQTEPHQPFAPLPPVAARRPTNYVPQRLPKPTDKAHVDAGEALAINCGGTPEDEFVKQGWNYELLQGFSYNGLPAPINYCWADYKSVVFEITCPKGARGTLKLYIADPDGYGGGRKESVTVAGRKIGNYENFQKGLWIEAPVSAADTTEGKFEVVIANIKGDANAVISQVRFVEAP